MPTERTNQQGPERARTDESLRTERKQADRAFADRQSTVESERSARLGLGLYISRCIVEAHGGTITATSTLGVGSVFSFTLPVSGAAAR